jgi:hypothetical protein
LPVIIFHVLGAITRATSATTVSPIHRRRKICFSASHILETLKDPRAGISLLRLEAKKGARNARKT